MVQANDYGHMLLMRALHEVGRRVYYASPWGAENTMRAVAHHQPCPQHTVVASLIHWPHWDAHWDSQRYTNNFIPSHFRPENDEPAWCADMHLLWARSAL